MCRLGGARGLLLHRILPFIRQAAQCAQTVRGRGRATAPRRMPRERRRIRDYHFGTRLAGTPRAVRTSVRADPACAARPV
jgi:hypothetical protein